MRLVWVLCALFGACASSTFREAVSPLPDGARKVAPWNLNRELLMPETQRIVFLVEHMAGDPPEPRALDDLVALAERYGGRPARWITHRRRDPILLERDSSYVIVKYVGEQLPNFGVAYARWIEARWVYFLVINQSRHRRWQSLVPERRLEQQTLIHEYGHLLGLPTFDHGYFPHYPARTDGLHCVNPECPLSKPRPRAVLYKAFHIAFGRNYDEDYCAECRRAIEEAQRYWRDAR